MQNNSENQLLLPNVLDVYLEADGALSNQEVYKAVADRLGMSEAERSRREPVGEAGKSHNIFHNRVRWAQQSLRREELLTRVNDGEWEVHRHKKLKLRAAKATRHVVAVSTSVGMCIWTKSPNIFEDVIQDDVHLVLTSPPYPIQKPRAYGGIHESEYTDFICRAIEPIMTRMVPGASIVLNLSNDVFEQGSPARSIYLERLVVALHDNLGLKLMDRKPWESNKPPGPVHWCSKKRIHLNVGWEPVLWFCNEPLKTFACVDRVLQEHSERHKKFVAKGGVKTESVHGDGAYRKKVGAYSRETKGRIPTNVLHYGNTCKSGQEVTAFAKELGIPEHGAKMPLSLAQFLVEFLTEPGQTVVDPFAGTLTTAQAAQITGRKWFCLEQMMEYIRQGFRRFRDLPDAWINPDIVRATST